MTVVPQPGGVYRMQRGPAISRGLSPMDGVSFMPEVYYMKYLFLLGCSLFAATPAQRPDALGRIENVTDAGYQTAAGYGTSGRTAANGARAGRWPCWR